jgi:hypothetical protein
MRRPLSLLLIMLLLAGCASVEERKRSLSFQSTTRAYEGSIRWSDFETAGNFINREKVTEPGPDPELLERIHVTSYQVLSTSIADDGSEAHLLVEIRYYDEQRMSEVRLTDRQTWQYDEQVEAWYLASPLPAFQ